METGKIHYKVELDNTRLKQDANESKQILHNIGNTAKQEGERIDNSFKNIGKTIAGVFAISQIVNFAREVIKVRGEIESLEVSFRTLLGSEQKAKALFGELREFAVKTPLLLNTLAKGAQILLGFNYSADKVMPSLKAIGDVSMGDAQKFESLTLAFAQIQSSGKLMGQDLMQLINAGFNPLAEISRKTGKSIGELKEEMSKGAISAQMIEEAFISATSEGGKFYKMLESQSQTINGAISNLQGAWDDMLNDIGESTQGVFTDAIALATYAVQHYKPFLNVMLSLVTAFGAYKTILMATYVIQKSKAMVDAVRLMFMFRKELGLATAAQQAFNITAMKNPYVLLASVIIGVITAIVAFTDSTEDATDALEAERLEAEEFNRQVSDSAGKSIATYKKLQAEYQRCKNEHEKNSWIKTNRHLFNELGVAVNGVVDAEKVFVKNTDAMLSALKQRAEANVWDNKVTQLSAKRIDRLSEIDAINRKITTNAEVLPEHPHDARKGMYVGNDGKWRYTAEGAKSFKINPKEDARLKSIDAEINEAIFNAQLLLDEANKILNGGNKTTGDSDKDADSLAKQQHDRESKIRKYSEDLIRDSVKAEQDIRQANINAMSAGTDKQIAQINLDYDRMKLANEERANKMVEELRKVELLKWEKQNPKATEQQKIEKEKELASKISVENLSENELKILKEYDRLALEHKKRANSKMLDSLLKDYKTYEQQRNDIARDFETKRNALYTTDANGDKVLRDGVTQGNVDELNRKEKETYEALDEQFAQRESTYQSWCDSLSEYTLDELESILKDAEAMLADLEKNNPSDPKLAEARAKVTKATETRDKLKSKKSTSPDKRSVKEWEDLYKVLNECNDSFKEIGETVGGVAGEILSKAGEITTSALSMINGIMQLTQMSAVGIKGTATAAATAISTIEKASVILTIISAAMQVAIQIANLFNNDKQREKEIEVLQGRIDQLQWELDHQDIVKLHENRGRALDIVNQKLRETYSLLLQGKGSVKGAVGAIRVLLTGASVDQKILSETANDIAKAYQNVAYSADKAFGNDKYKDAQKQLELIAKQQILIQEQIYKEKDKKHSDKDRVRDWEQKIEELGMEAISIINEMVEDIIGGSSNDIANELSDAFFEAFKNGEDYAQAWGDKVDEIVADIMQRMLVSKFLEEPLGDIFDKYKAKWFKDGRFVGVDAIMSSMGGFAEDMKSVGADFSEIWESLPESVRNMFVSTDSAIREASSKGIATASQESVDELNGRATAIQGHTFSIMESSKMLVNTSNQILKSVLNIEDNSSEILSRVNSMEDNLKSVKDTVNDFSIKGIKIK